MFFIDLINEYSNEKLDIYVDMDGVIADYIVGEAREYDKKRPLYTSLKYLEEVSKYDNVTMHILSISRSNKGVDEKNEWLDKFAPFFKKENRVIIPREANGMKPSVFLKCDYVSNLKDDDRKIIIIDDDPQILHELMNKNKDRNILLLKDTVLVD
jgi:hypothetical protein